MTLMEMSVEYRSNCLLLKERIRLLRARLKAAPDPAETLLLQQRISELTALYREGREIAVHMERYYERGYRHNDRYTF